MTDCLTDNLPSLFAEILSKYSDVSNFSESQSSQKFKDLVVNACHSCEKAIELINQLSLFSKNESLDDLSSNEIKYMCLPALLAFFKSQQNDDRLSNIQTAESLYKGFLNICSDYGVVFPCSGDGNNNVKATANSLAQMEANREAKIKRYKMKKSLEERLEELSVYINQPHVDDETKREFNLTLVKKWICIAQDDIPNLRTEIDLLSRIQNHGEIKDEEKKISKPLQPFIITRTQAQAAVFGAGYPSLPTMTLDEFCEEQVAAGIFPPLRPISAYNNNDGSKPTFRRIDPSEEEREAAEKKKAKEDELEDKDDLDALMKARKFDEFKDEHRRGSGNRMNRS